MKTVGTTPFFVAVMATTSHAAAAAIPDAAAAEQRVEEVDAPPVEDTRRVRFNMPTVPELVVAAKSFHASVTSELDSNDIPAPVQQAFETVLADRWSTEAAREYFSAVERVIGEEIPDRPS